MADPTIPQPASPIRKRRRFRRLLTAVIVLTVLVVAGVIAVRIVLGGDLPRRIIVDRLQRATGLSVEVAEARVGWRGRTVLKDVVFRLPLDSQPLAAAPLIEVLHSPVHQIVASGDPGLQEISIMGASVDIREDHRGRWSPARAVSLVQAARQGTSQGSGPPLIPTLNISNSTVNVSRSGQAPVVLALVLKGQPIDAVSYAIDVMIGDSHLVGRVSTTDLDHAIEVKTANIEPLVKLFAGDVPSPIVIDATWDGSWNAGLAGELSIKTIRIGEGAATGRVSVSLQSGAMTARPVLLTISSPRLSRSPLTLSGGSVRLDSMAAIVESTRIQLPNLMTELSGEWRFGPRTGDASMTWTGREHERRLVHQGKARLNATLPSTGPRTITAVVDSSGNTPEQSWRTQAKLEVTGLNWRNLRGAVEFPVLLVSDAEGPMDFSGLRAEALAKFPAISLTSLHLPGVRDLNASARFDMESQQWSLDASTASLALPRLAINPSVAVRASGDLERVEDFDVKAAIGERIVSAQGSYIPSRARPLAAHVELRSPIPPSADKVVSTHSGAAASLDIEGDVQPLSLHARGVLAAKDVKLRGRALTPIEIGISIDATREGVVFELPTFPICGGTAAVAGAFDARTNMIAARVRAESIDLKSAV
ncbi:MAG: hypothetical protein H7210_12225, partial [Pyrinomonadaceae bacterium]|nr:hypothetical protein [Phycisphaerales bacterium]